MGGREGEGGGADASQAPPADLGERQRSPDDVGGSKSRALAGADGGEVDGDGEAGGRHAKYDAEATPPWLGGQVKPFLYGRKVVFILGGRRQAPLYR